MKNPKIARAGILLSCAMMLVCGIVAATVLAADQNEAPQTVGVVQWQFCSLKVAVNEHKRDVDRQILKLGKEGWELVSVENFSESGDTTETAYYFKRRL